MRRAVLGRFTDDVVPLLPGPARASALSLFERLTAAPADVVVHGDLGPEHVLVRGDAITGVIEWSDAPTGDLAKDLAWALHDTPAPFAAAVAEGYGITPAQRERALDRQRIGPFYVVAHGLDTGAPEHVASGLQRITHRR